MSDEREKNRKIVLHNLREAHERLKEVVANLLASDCPPATVRHAEVGLENTFLALDALEKHEALLMRMTMV